MNELSTEITQKAQQYLSTLGCKVTPAQQVQFLEICKAFNLNPFTREIYAIPYGNNFNIIVGYEVYIKRAEASGRLNGWRAWVETINGELRGFVEIHRKDWHTPFIHEVSFKEYASNKGLWQTKPETMIKKVAIAQGFRLCFSMDLGGLPYTQEELDQSLPSNAQPIQPQVAQVSHTTRAENAQVAQERQRSQDEISQVALSFANRLKECGLNKEQVAQFCKEREITRTSIDKMQFLLKDDFSLNAFVKEFLQKSEVEQVSKSKKVVSEPVEAEVQEVQPQEQKSVRQQFMHWAKEQNISLDELIRFCAHFDIKDDDEARMQDLMRNKEKFAQMFNEFYGVETYMPTEVIEFE